MAESNPLDFLTLARELELRDRDVAARLDALHAVLGAVDAIRSRATRARKSLASIPEQLEHAEVAGREARRRADDADRELVEASRRAEEAARSRRASEEARSAAERTLRRAKTTAEDAAAAVTRADARLTGVSEHEASLGAEAGRLEGEAREAAARVGEVPRVSDTGRMPPGSGLEGVEEWGARAHSALFVVRGGLENERERLVVEANGLAAAVLGDHAGGASVALVRERLERAG